MLFKAKMRSAPGEGGGGGGKRKSPEANHIFYALLLLQLYATPQQLNEDKGYFARDIPSQKSLRDS